MRRKFIPALFDKEGWTMSDDERGLFANSVKSGGIGIRMPMEEAKGLNRTSKEASAVVVRAIVAGEKINLASHKEVARKASTATRKSRKEGELYLLAEQQQRACPKVKKRLARIGETGA